MNKSPFVYRRHMSIGEADAESDTEFLQSCFIDTGDLDVLRSTSNPKCIVVGRTGAGKTALLDKLENSVENAIILAPEALSLNHISNSNIIGFFEDLGVSLDVFYNLLWRHIFVVEIIKKKYHIDSEVAKNSFISNLASIFDFDFRKKKAIKYIEEWGEKFWLETEPRIKEFTDKLEEKLQSALEAKVPGLKASSAAASTLSSEAKMEVKYNAQKVVSEVQIKELSEIVSLLGDHILADQQNRFYIIIDGLDEKWVDDGLRYKLIRALIETIKSFRKIKSLKIVVSLRIDLLNRVLDNTKDAGFQLEKYESLFLELAWTENQLKGLLDGRINHLLKHCYTKQDVGFYDIFPKKLDGANSLDYILKRTLMRPRDAIMFINACLIEAEGKTEIILSTVKAAEKDYSNKRLRSLVDEWLVEHPRLDKYIEIFRGGKPSLKVQEISDSAIDDLICMLTCDEYKAGDSVTKCAYDNLQKNLSREAFTQALLFTLYKVGIIGIKPDGLSSVIWAHGKEVSLAPTHIRRTSIIYIHKMIWATLSINTRIN